LRVNVSSTKALIEETIFTSPAENRTAILRGHLSPLQRLRLGIPIKIAIIEKIESARGTMGRGKRLALFFFLPASPQYKETPS